MIATAAGMAALTLAAPQFALLAPFLLPAANAAEPAAATISWSPTLDAALAQGRSQHKPVMVDFYTDWCGWCQKLDSDTYTDAAVANLANASFVPVKVNAEKEGADAAAKYHVDSYPTILFLNPDTGTVEHRISGYLDAGPFRAEMQGVLTRGAQVPALQAQIAANPNDTASLVQLAALESDGGDFDAAAATLARAERSDPNDAHELLGPAYLAAAKSAAQANDGAHALPLFVKAAQFARSAEDRAFARLAAGLCKAQQSDLTGARADFTAVRDAKETPDALRQTAVSLLARLDAAGKATTQR
jgi:thioredoxin-like negative regulator of GroEL